MSTRRSRNVKNLQEAVESIFSQDEGDEYCKIGLDENQKLSRTPSQTEKFNKVSTPKVSQAALQDILQTPRRSGRKSVKPTQDYEDIVNQSLRYCTRSAKKSLSSDVENDENNEDENVKPKWTPAKVGRFSEKRSRKSKRTGKRKDQYDKNTGQVKGGNNKEESLEVKLENAEKVKTLKPLNDKFEEINEVCQSQKVLKTSISMEQDDIIENMQSLNVKLESFKEQDKKVEDSDIAKEADLNNQSVQLIQEDSEESIEKSEEEEICIIYENNISNLKVKEVKEKDVLSKSPSVSSDDDSFGCYLKSKKINISDLGLNPLNQEDDINVHNITKTSSQEVEEMPSLIICDDDEQIEGSKPATKINQTFEANENVEEIEIEKCLKQNEEVMETLQLSDDDCTTPAKRPRIFLTDTKGQNITILSGTKEKSHVTAKTSTSKGLTIKMPGTPKQSMQGSAIKTKLPVTPKALSAKLPCTPKQTKKVNRFPTPYKNNFNLDEVKENVKKTSSRVLSDTSLISITTLEPKEVVLRGIRKRSLSVSINDKQRHNFLAGPLDKQKNSRMVSFYSPANQTTIIDELDVAIAKSLKKQKNQGKESLKKYVTTRRKRSMSFDETLMSSSIASKLPRPVPGQNAAKKIQNSSLSKTLKRTKLPNFAAIHEKHFDKMENLVEHVNRKQERSKNLINSATKLFPTSAQKNIFLNKNINNITAKKTNVLKKIDFNPKSQIIEKSNFIAKPATQKKPAFNLSTSVNLKPSTSASNSLEKGSTSSINSENKVTSRLQRHMELFKGRSTAARADLAPRGNQAILKGVRSNRRFELQMQHRKNLEQ